MNRRTRTMIVVGVAVAMAGVASFGVYRAIQNIPERTKYIPAHYLVVAKQDVPVGTILEAQHVRLAGWPQDTNVEGSFAKIEDVLGRGATAQIVANEPIIDRKLAPKEAGGGLPPTIPAGMRAMSVKVNDVIGVAGFTVPGTRVDVLVTIEASRPGQHLARRAEQHPGARRRHEVRSGAVEERPADQDRGRHLARDAARRGEARAGADRGPDRAGAAQSARCRGRGDKWPAHVEPARRSGAGARCQSVQGRPRVVTPAGAATRRTEVHRRRDPWWQAKRRDHQERWGGQ